MGWMTAVAIRVDMWTQAHPLTSILVLPPLVIAAAALGLYALVR